MAGIAPSIANAIVNAQVRATPYTGPASLWLALHTGDPGTTGANEVSGGSYARQQVTFSAPTNGVAASAADINFDSMPAATVTHVSFWDAKTAGNFQQASALAANVAVAAGNGVRFPAGNLTYAASGS